MNAMPALSAIAVTKYHLQHHLSNEVRNMTRTFPVNVGAASAIQHQYRALFGRANAAPSLNKDVQTLQSVHQDCNQISQNSKSKKNGMTDSTLEEMGRTLMNIWNCNPQTRQCPIIKQKSFRQNQKVWLESREAHNRTHGSL